MFLYEWKTLGNAYNENFRKFIKEIFEISLLGILNKNI